MPKLVIFLAKHAALGFALAVAFVGGLVALDIGHLRTLLTGSGEAWLPAFVLTFAMGLTFSSVQMGVAVMLLGEDEPRQPAAPKGGRRARGPGVPALRPAPARVPVRR
ncbi:hypothetical protein [Roseixanthobacter glucoisosaccharinicivorans]|uniref:hypothetical protein n=1 Tax=Roseixanthobacter glucoisosaccharinicivorans TaxID=3119923 RepID=UPI003728347C